MENIFVEFLPPWVETGLQPAFYDKESGTVLQQTARMYARVNMLIRMFNKLSKNTKTEVERFEEVVDTRVTNFEESVNTRVTNFENSVNETVADYIEQFNQLHDYVHDYFDNLDVQEEINNKLDQMLEDGVLQEIITTYIQSNVAWTFDTVADMKQATNLINGSYAQTLGFHTINDGGGAIYKITNSGTANEMDVIAIGSSLYANLVMDGKITPEMYGAYGDDTHDDSTSIQRAFDTASVVDFLNKTYMCYALTCNYDNKKLVIHGNGATLKRPNLSAEPYNMTPEQMKWIQTIFVSTDCEIRDLNFDNNCFTMWQVSDGYAQEQACSVIVRNLEAIVNFTIDNCYFKNSAGDGLHLAQNVNAQITNCKSTDCFRGGLTLTGYGCEINVDGWISETITPGVNDGFDIEVDSSSTIYPTKFICNMNNIVIDYDLDIGVPPSGIVNINNLIMREYDTTAYNGYIFYVQGNLNITNSVLRYGTGTDFTHIQIRGDGQMNMDSCYLYGTSSHALLDIQGNNANGNTKFNINNCTADCGTFMAVALFNGFINVTNCNVKCSGKFIDRAGATSPHVKWLNVDNCTIDCSDPDACMRIEQTSGSFPVDVTLRLNNINCVGSCPTFLLCNGGHPKVIFGTLVFENAVKLQTGYGGSPYFYGDKRIIVVNSADDLSFKGWVPGHDEAIIKGTNNRYRYTSGTTWTAI